MKRNIFKGLVVSIIATQLFATGLYAAIDVTADKDDLFGVVVNNTSPENYVGIVAITSYTEEYVADGVRFKREVSNIQYNLNNDGLVESCDVAYYSDDVLREQRNINVWVNDLLDIRYRFRVLSLIRPGPNVLHVFLKPAASTGWRVRNIVVSNLDTGEELGVTEYSESQCDTVAQLQLINQKLDDINNNVSNSERNVINSVNTTEGRLTELLRKVLQYLQDISARLRRRGI